MTASTVSTVLSRFADSVAAAVPEVDSRAEHDRWKPGIGPFEEENQLEMLVNATGDQFPHSVATEQPYLSDDLRCDLLIESEEIDIPIEAKLLRFRYDNGNINPANFTKVFSPFPERTSASLLTDAKKLYEADFQPSGGLLGLYYEKVDEPYEEMDADAIAEKFRRDVDYWYDFEVEVTNVARFEGLRHPHHERGAIIAWRILDE